MDPPLGPSDWSNGEGPREALERNSVVGSLVELLAKEISACLELVKVILM